MDCCLFGVISGELSPKGARILGVLQVLCCVQVCLGLFNLFVNVWSGVFLLLGAAVLLLVVCQKNWYSCICYTAITLVDSFTTVSSVGEYFTEHGGVEGAHGAMVFILLLKLPFYLVSLFYVHLAYRELKGND